MRPMRIGAGLTVGGKMVGYEARRCRDGARARQASTALPRRMVQFYSPWNSSRMKTLPAVIGRHPHRAAAG
jgi:hypothetical protein